MFFFSKRPGASLLFTTNLKPLTFPIFPLTKNFGSLITRRFILFPLGYGPKVFGIGLKQSLSFDATIRVLRSFFLFCLFLLLVRENSSKVRSRELLLFVLLSFITTDADRPDDLALLFGVLSFLASRLYKTPYWSGLLLGLTAATSPAAGFYFGVGQLFFKPKWKEAVPIAVIGFGVFYGLTAPIQWLDREAYLRFSKQLPLSVFPYLQRYRAEHRILGTYYDWRGYLWNATDLVRPYFLLILTYFALLFVKPDTLYKNRFIKFNIFFFYFWLLVWTLQPYYLWFLILVSLCFVLSYCREKWVYAFIVLLFAPLYKPEIKLVANALIRPPEEKREFVLSKLKSEIPFGSTVVVTPDQYFTFRKDWEVANITYICPYLSDFKYVFVSRFQSANIETKNYEFFCADQENLFQIKKDLTHFRPYFSYYIKGHSGLLYERRS